MKTNTRWAGCILALFLFPFGFKKNFKNIDRIHVEDFTRRRKAMNFRVVKTTVEYSF